MNGPGLRGYGGWEDRHSRAARGQGLDPRLDPSSPISHCQDGRGTLHRRWRTEGLPPQGQARLLSLDLGKQGPCRASHWVRGVAFTTLAWALVPTAQELEVPGPPVAHPGVPDSWTSDLAGCRGNPKPMGPWCGPGGDCCLRPGGSGAVRTQGQSSEEQAH